MGWVRGSRWDRRCRLDKCGMDGALVYLVKAFGYDEGTVAKMW
jgi:hypothetical protein